MFNLNELVEEILKNLSDEAIAKVIEKCENETTHTETNTNEEITDPYVMAQALRAKARLYSAHADVIEATQECYSLGYNPYE